MEPGRGTKDDHHDDDDDDDDERWSVNMLAAAATTGNSTTLGVPQISQFILQHISCAGGEVASTEGGKGTERGAAGGIKVAA